MHGAAFARLHEQASAEMGPTAGGGRVSPSKRAGADARRRQDEQEALRRRHLAAQRRRRLVAASVVAAMVVLTAAGAMVIASRPAPSDRTATDSAADFLDGRYDAPPPAAEAQGRTWPVTLQTSLGDLVLELDGAAAPRAVASFLMLARDGYFDGTTCHRLVVGQVVQCGDPTRTGAGGPGYAFGPVENDPADMTYPAGTVAMARRANDPHSHGSQFFITLTDVVLPGDTAGGYTVFGRVTSGADPLTRVDAGGTVDGGPDGPPAVNLTIEGVVIP